MSLRLVSHRTSLSVVMACVAVTLVFLGLCRLPVSHFWRQSLSLVHGVFRSLLSILCLQRVSLISCFHGVCRLPVVFTACVAFQLAISGVCRFHSSFMVCFIFCSPFSVHSACRLQLVFMAMACTTFKLFSWRVSP